MTSAVIKALYVALIVYCCKSLIRLSNVLSNELRKFSLLLAVTIVTDVETLEITMTTNNEHVSSISAGSNVTLHCSTTEPVELKEVQWRKDRKGFTITNARVNTERDSNGTIVSSDLHLLNVSTKRTNGLYECLSWTKTSKNVSASYSLHVDGEYKINIIIVHAKDVCVKC